MEENNLRNRGFCFKAFSVLLSFTKNSCCLMFFSFELLKQPYVQRLSSDSTRQWLTGECLLTDTESAHEESCKLKQITNFLDNQIPQFHFLTFFLFSSYKFLYQLLLAGYRQNLLLKPGEVFTSKEQDHALCLATSQNTEGQRASPRQMLKMDLKMKLMTNNNPLKNFQAAPRICGKGLCWFQLG